MQKSWVQYLAPTSDGLKLLVTLLPEDSTAFFWLLQAHAYNVVYRGLALFVSNGIFTLSSAPAV